MRDPVARREHRASSGARRRWVAAPSSVPRSGGGSRSDCPALSLIRRRFRHDTRHDLATASRTGATAALRRWPLERRAGRDTVAAASGGGATILRPATTRAHLTRCRTSSNRPSASVSPQSSGDENLRYRSTIKTLSKRLSAAGRRVTPRRSPPSMSSLVRMIDKAARAVRSTRTPPPARSRRPRASSPARPTPSPRASSLSRPGPPPASHAHASSSALVPRPRARRRLTADKRSGAPGPVSPAAAQCRRAPAAARPSARDRLPPLSAWSSSAMRTTPPRARPARSSVRTRARSAPGTRT